MVAELGGSHDVIMEAIPMIEHQPNGVVERAVQTVGGLSSRDPMVDHPVANRTGQNYPFSVSVCSTFCWSANEAVRTSFEATF